MPAGDANNVTTIEPTQRLGPGPSRTPTPQERLAYDACERNHQFFLANKWDLFDRHPEHWLLIYDDQTVEAFADPLDCIDRRDSLEPDIQATVWIGTPDKPGIWIL